MYAQVLVDVVQAKDSGLRLDQVLGELREFGSLTKEAPVFGKVFNNPTLSDEEKQKALAELVSRSGLTPISSRFLSLLARRGRLQILNEILKEVEVIEVEKRGGLTGELVSAIPLDVAVVQNIEAALGKRLHKPIQLNQRVDSGLIAGMRVTVSGVTYDGSVRGKLDKLSGNLTTT